MFLESLLSYDSSWSQIYSRENCSLQDSGQARLLSGCSLSYLPLKRPENYQWDFRRLSLCFRESLGSRVSPCPTKPERHNDLRVSPTPSSHVCNHRASYRDFSGESFTEVTICEYSISVSQSLAAAKRHLFRLNAQNDQTSLIPYQNPVT